MAAGSAAGVVVAGAMVVGGAVVVGGGLPRLPSRGVPRSQPSARTAVNSTRRIPLAYCKTAPQVGRPTYEEDARGSR